VAGSLTQDTNVISELRKRERADSTALEHSLALVTRHVDDISRTGVALVNPFAPG